MRAKTDAFAHALADLFRQPSDGTLVRARLQDELDFLHRFLFKNFHAKLFDLVKFPHHVFYGAGKNVDATDNKHIIHPAQHATLQSQERFAAWAGLVAGLNQIAGAVTNHGAADPAEVGDDQLAFSPSSTAAPVSGSRISAINSLSLTWTPPVWDWHRIRRRQPRWLQGDQSILLQDSSIIFFVLGMLAPGSPAWRVILMVDSLARSKPAFLASEAMCSAYVGVQISTVAP